MSLIHLVINSQEVFTTFSPITLVEEIVRRCKGNGELPIDVYITEVK